MRPQTSIQNEALPEVNATMPASQRLHLLDTLRGLAAFAVVVWHFNAFAILGIAPLDLESIRGKQAFYTLLRPFYDQGFRAVDLFFSLSGFIFYFFYSEKVASGQIGPRDFALLRFSRLYPLHAATLVLAALLQIAYRSINGTFFAHPHNDAYHFILNVFFVSSWGLEKGESFNGPTWSVSVEMLLYLQFFLLCRRRYSSLPATFFLAAAGFLIQIIYAPIGRGMFSFFLGGAAWHTFDALHRKTLSSRQLALLIGAIAVAAIMSGCVLGLESGRVSGDIIALVRKIRPTAHADRLLDLPWELYFGGVLFPSTVLILALLEQKLHLIASRMSWIGDLTYSSYLLHFPLQLAFLIVASLMSARISVESHLVFLSFVGLVFGLAYLTFHGFERPAQTWIRKAFANRPPTTQDAISPP